MQHNAPYRTGKGAQISHVALNCDHVKITQSSLMSKRMAEIADIENYISKCALGDRDAFSALYAVTSAKLFGVCLCLLGG